MQNVAMKVWFQQATLHSQLICSRKIDFDMVVRDGYRLYRTSPLHLTFYRKTRSTYRKKNTLQKVDNRYARLLPSNSVLRPPNQVHNAGSPPRSPAATCSGTTPPWRPTKPPSERRRRQIWRGQAYIWAWSYSSTPSTDK